MPTIKIAYEDIRQEAKELLKELKKTNPKAKLTQAQVLVANKYDCKNLAVLRNKAKKNNKVLEIELTDKIVSSSTELIKQLFTIESFNDNGIACATVYVKGRKDTSGKTVRLDEKTIENLLDDKNTILTFHDHFRYVIGDYYLELLCILLSNKNNTIFDIDKYIHIESLAEIAKKHERREEDVYLLDFARTSTKDLEKIDNESRKVIESNIMSKYFLTIDEYDSFPSEEKTYLLHSGSSKICYCEICLRKRESPLYDIFNILDISERSNSLKEFLFRTSEYKKTVKEPSLLRKGRIEKFFDFKDIIQQKLSSILEKNRNEQIAYQKILIFLNDMKSIIISKTLHNVMGTICVSDFSKEFIYRSDVDALLLDFKTYKDNEDSIKEFQNNGILVSQIRVP